MTADQVFKYYRAYKFFYAGTYNDLQRYANIKCPPLLNQKDRQFYYRIARTLNDTSIHALFTTGFFFKPRAHISDLASRDAWSTALTFASRAENGETLFQADLYELKKHLSSISDIDAWLYGESDNGKRVLIPGCIQDVITGFLPLDIACLVLLIPQTDLNYHWLDTIELGNGDDGWGDMGLGAMPWVDRLKKLDQLLNIQRPLWRLTTHRLAKDFWHSFGLQTLAPTPVHTEPSLF